MADTNIVCNPVELTLSLIGIGTQIPGTARDYSLDYEIEAGPIDIPLTVLGGLLSGSFDSCLIGLSLSVHGTLVIGEVISCGPINIAISVSISGVVSEARRCNWIKWSKVGNLNFTIDESNVAGERPLDWKGCVYEILKLDKQIVTYGENGVTILVPAGIAYGMQTIHRIGVICKTAIAGTDTEHYFIDRTDKLYKLSSEGLRLLDYSEYLSLLTNPRLSLDPETGLLYICDGSTGFIYSTRYESFGSGPTNISGIGSQSGTLYVVSPSAIEIPKLEICTDIYDLGTRKAKTIQFIEIGTDLAYVLEAMIESRVSNEGEFIESNWVLVNPSGIAYIPCYGVEFRFHLRSYIYEYLELDYIKVNGVIHGFNYLDYAMRD